VVNGVLVNGIIVNVPIAIGKWQNPLHIIEKNNFNINRKLSSFSFGEGQDRD
jgi:hypothetical protein